MTDAPARSRRPYLLRAMHEWISDNQQTPHLVVDATIAGVEVPRQYVQDGKIILNVSLNATSGLNLGNDGVRVPRTLRRDDPRRQRADRRGAGDLCAGDRAGNDFLGGRCAAPPPATPPETRALRVERTPSARSRPKVVK